MFNENNPALSPDDWQKEIAERKKAEHARLAIEQMISEISTFLQAEPISQKRMVLLWLDPPRLTQLEQPLAQQKIVTVTMGSTASNVQDHEITQEDFEWAKQIERIVDKAYSAGQRGNFNESIRYYKEALHLAPGCDLFLMSIGVCYAEVGQKAKGLRYLERAAQISPDNTRNVVI